MRKRVRKLTRRKTIMTKAKSKRKRGVYIKRKKSKKIRKKSNKLRKKRTQQNSHIGGSAFAGSPGYFGPGENEESWKRRNAFSEKTDWKTIPMSPGSDPLSHFFKELDLNDRMENRSSSESHPLKGSLNALSNAQQNKTPRAKVNPNPFPLTQQYQPTYESDAVKLARQKRLAKLAGKATQAEQAETGIEAQGMKSAGDYSDSVAQVGDHGDKHVVKHGRRVGEMRVAAADHLAAADHGDKHVVKHGRRVGETRVAAADHLTALDHLASNIQSNTPRYGRRVVKTGVEGDDRTIGTLAHTDSATDVNPLTSVTTDNATEETDSQPQEKYSQARAKDSQARARGYWKQLQLYENMRKMLKSKEDVTDVEVTDLDDFHEEEEDMAENAMLRLAHAAQQRDTRTILDPAYTLPWETALWGWDPNRYVFHNSQVAREIYNKHLNYAHKSLNVPDENEKGICLIQAMIDSHRDSGFQTFLLENFVDNDEQRRHNPGMDHSVKNFDNFCTRMILIGVEPEYRPGKYEYERVFDDSTGEWVEPTRKIAYEPWWNEGREREYVKHKLNGIFRKFKRSDKVRQIPRLMSEKFYGYGNYGYLLLTAVILKYYKGIDISRMIGNVFIPIEDL